MPSLKIYRKGVRWLLPEIERLSQRERQELWPKQRQRVEVARLLVEKKLKVLATQGVTWDGVSGFSRLSRAKFDATRKREHRIVRGITLSKKSPDNWSHFVRFKCASHLTLRGSVGDVVWKTLDDRSSYDFGLLSAADVRLLLSPYARPRLPPVALAHLRLECQSAASCSWGFLFGKGNLGA